MKTFILVNLFLFFSGLYLVFSAFMNFRLFLTLPTGIEILIIIGFVTPLMNLYDTITNFFTIANVLRNPENEE